MSTTTAAELKRILKAKADLKTAINNKGGNITNETIDKYASQVDELPTPKEEQQKTISPSTSPQDVLPDSGKVLSKVTVTAIPTETKSRQPNLARGNQTINATSGKFMTSFTITKDTVNHIASNIRKGITLYGVTGTLESDAGLPQIHSTLPETVIDGIIIKVGDTYYLGDTTWKELEIKQSGD